MYLVHLMIFQLLSLRTTNTCFRKGCLFRRLPDDETNSLPIQNSKTSVNKNCLLDKSHSRQTIKDFKNPTQIANYGILLTPDLSLQIYQRSSTGRNLFMLQLVPK